MTMTLKSTFGLFPQRLASLLTAGAADEAPPRDLSPAEAAGQLLRQRLAGPLALDETHVDSLPAVLGRPCEDLGPFAGRTVGDVLLDPAVPLGVLETLKDYGKELSCRWDEGPEHMVAVAIYFAAVAAGLAFHGKKMTTRSYPDLDRSLGMLMDDRWMTRELAGLFGSARKACERKEQ